MRARDPAVLSVLSQLAEMDRSVGRAAPVPGQAALQNLIRDLTVARLRRWVGPAPLGRLVDLGCGRGGWALRYLALAERVVGVEPDPRLVARARRAAWRARLGGRAVFLRLGLERYTRYQGVGLVCLGRPLQAFEAADLERLLALVVGGLGPGGRLYLRARVASALDGRAEPGWSRAGLEARLARFGLVVEDAFYAAALLPGAALDELGRLPPGLAGRLAVALWEVVRREPPGGRLCHFLLRVRASVDTALALAG
jgi:SAM-dependent methyltransferase